jgi:hypothetical protein
LIPAQICRNSLFFPVYQGISGHHQFSLNGTIELASQLPNVTDKQLTVTGPITISGQGNVEIVSVASYATLHLAKLTMTDGFGAYDPTTGFYEGGAIWNGGTVTLYNTALNDSI